MCGGGPLSARLGTRRSRRIGADGVGGGGRGVSVVGGRRVGPARGVRRGRDWTHAGGAMLKSAVKSAPITFSPQTRLRLNQPSR